MNTCAICNIKFEAESPAILFINRYGMQRTLCKDCEALLDRASVQEDSPERAEAVNALTDLALSIKDPDAIAVLRDVLDGKTSAEVNEEEQESAYSSEEAFEEDEQEEEETKTKKLSVFWDIIAPIVAGVWGLALLLWFIFR